MNSPLATHNAQLSSRPTESVVDLGAIARNYRLLQNRVGERVAMIAVLKANAYGHGAAAVA
ncbi:MAG TPA: alanine racemase, partial [Thermoanaerobaculia bacterium]|nr:alanine racemase [Thermoanaerobaculia bacterium]